MPSNRAIVLPLALAQFIASYAATNMNVAITAIAHDLGTTVAALQTTITLFTLTMASLMIPGSKLTDIWGRKNCFVAGLIVYGFGALLAALAPGIGLMIVGYSLLEGIGSALMIPPVYILITVAFDDTATRAKYFGVVSGAGGLGAAAGPLIGGLVTTWIGWRASFVLQVLVVAWIVVLARRFAEPPRSQTRTRFDVVGAVLCAAGLCLVVFGILQTREYGWFAFPVWALIGAGALILVWFFVHLRSAESPLLNLRLFGNRTANLGLGTQLVQWLVLQGAFFVISLYLQEVRMYNAIETGLMLTPATAGILVAAGAAERFAKRRTQRWLIVAGFVTTAIGMVLLLALARETSGVVNFVPGLLLIGLGIGVMLTSSVNVVQSSFPDADQGDISGVSRSVSNLGSSLGTALVGSILVGTAFPAGRPFALALATLLGFTLAGLVIALFIPQRRRA